MAKRGAVAPCPRFKIKSAYFISYKNKIPQTQQPLFSKETYKTLTFSQST
jgi:hypothetical protein